MLDLGQVYLLIPGLSFWCGDGLHFGPGVPIHFRDVRSAVVTVPGVNESRVVVLLG